MLWHELFCSLLIEVRVMCQHLYEVSKLFPPRDDNFLAIQDLSSALETNGNLSAKDTLLGLIITLTSVSLVTKLYTP